MSPNKPTTLREEFLKDFPVKHPAWFSRQNVINWWLEKFSSHSTELVSKIEGMKVVELQKPKDLTEAVQKGMDWARNQTIDDVISIINQEK